MLLKITLFISHTSSVEISCRKRIYTGNNVYQHHQQRYKRELRMRKQQQVFTVIISTLTQS